MYLVYCTLNGQCFKMLPKTDINFIDANCELLGKGFRGLLSSALPENDKSKTTIGHNPLCPLTRFDELYCKA